MAKALCTLLTFVTPFFSLEMMHLFEANMCNMYDVVTYVTVVVQLIVC